MMLYINLSWKGNTTNKHKEKESTFRSLKNYSADVCKETLATVPFSNYNDFDNPNIAFTKSVFVLVLL